MSVNWKAICENLQGSLFALHASGSDGFEGLIRDAFREVTGVTLRLQKSGEQHGADVVSDNSEGSISIGIEAKRYRPTTSLPLDELKNKLIDASTRTNNPIELWILVASKEISGDDVAELRRLGDEQGLGILVLDWRSSDDPTAPLPLLLSMAPNAVRQYCGQNIVEALPAFLDHPEYGTQKTKLLGQLVYPDLGLTFAGKAVKENITRTLQTRASAIAQLQNPVDIESSSQIWVSRAELCREIQEWKADAAKVPVCALVGEEGSGKTWLMFDWWHGDKFSDDPPLIVWLSARDVVSGSLNEVIGTALEKWILTPKRNADFWARRIERWRQTHGVKKDVPFIGFMLDGVNEGRSQKNVLKLLHQAVAPEWKGKIEVLLSDRPIHWESKFLSGTILDTLPKVIKVSQFSKSELDGLLAKHGQKREDFSPEVLRMICWPRWFAVAAKLFNCEHDWSAHSPEQLMIRYWQHNLRDRGQVVNLSDEEFHVFMAGLGSDIKESLETAKIVSTVELEELLSSYSGAPIENIRKPLGDIISGIWMERIEANRFTIKKEVLPFAISLALLKNLKTSGTLQEADRECEQFLGPIESQTIGVEILGAAVSLAFIIEQEVPSYARKVLMTRWIKTHNFGTKHFEVMWRIATTSPDDFFSVAEDIWLKRESGHGIDEILIKGISNIANDSGYMSYVMAFIGKWARTYWLNPHEGQFIGYKVTAEERATASAETEERLGRLKAELGEDLFESMNLRCCENGSGASWLSHRIFAISTYLPRALQGDIWKGWVMSRTVMGNPRHFDELAWSLRFNPIDGPTASQMLTKVVDDLIAFNSPILRPQILSLLNAYGGKEGEKNLSSLGETFPTPQYTRLDDQVEIIDNIVQIKSTESRSGNDIAVLLSNFAKNSLIQISNDDKRQLEQFGKKFSINDFSVNGSRTSEYIFFERAEPALARWAPEELANIYRRLLEILSESDGSFLWVLTLSLDGLLLLLTEEIQRKITTFIIHRINEDFGDRKDQIIRSLVNAALFNQPADLQGKIFKAIGASKYDLCTPHVPIAAIPMALLQNLENDLHPHEEVQQLIPLLQYLYASQTKEFPKDWEALWALFPHGESTVRTLSFGIALKTDDHKLAQRLYETDWKASKEKSIQENCWGSCLLARATTPETFEAISQRIDPQWSDVLWKQFEYEPAYKISFMDFLVSSVEQECNPPLKRTFPEYRCSPKEATRKLLEQDEEAVTVLADKLFGLQNISGFFAYQWPRLELLRAFFETNPQQATNYWRKIEEGKDAFTGRNENFEELPFLAADCDEINNLREMLIMRAKTDWDLMKLASAILRYEKSHWASQWIKTILAEPKCPGDIARAVTLAGLLDDSVAAKELWAEDLCGSPLGGWIEVVYSHAKQRIERAWNSIIWLDRMFAAETDEHFFVFWRLVVCSLDYRVIPLALRRIQQDFDSMNPRRREFIEFNWIKVTEQTKKEKSQLERTLFATPIGFRWARPWSH